MDTAAQHRDEVRAVLDKINSTWLMEEPERISAILTPLFNDHAMIVGPGFAPMAEGNAACVASYVDFKKQAQIHSCKFSDLVIHIVAATAVATSGWDIAYTMNGTRYQETGQDVYVFARTGDEWRVTWRAMLSS